MNVRMRITFVLSWVVPTGNELVPFTIVRWFLWKNCPYNSMLKMTKLNSNQRSLLNIIWRKTGSKIATFQHYRFLYLAVHGCSCQKSAKFHIVFLICKFISLQEKSFFVSDCLVNSTLPTVKFFELALTNHELT